MKKSVRNGIIVAAIIASFGAPTIASAHVVRVSANDKVIALHSGPITPPAHQGGLLTASEAVDGVRDGQLNVGP